MFSVMKIWLGYRDKWLVFLDVMMKSILFIVISSTKMQEKTTPTVLQEGTGGRVYALIMRFFFPLANNILIIFLNIDESAFLFAGSLYY